MLIFRKTFLLVQYLVSSLSLDDCLVHRLREVVRFSILSTGRLYPSKKYSCYSFSVRGWVDPRATVRLVGLCQWKIPVTPLEIEHDTFRTVAQYLNRRHYRVSCITSWCVTCLVLPRYSTLYRKRHDMCWTWNASLDFLYRFAPKISHSKTNWERYVTNVQTPSNRVPVILVRF